MSPVFPGQNKCPFTQEICNDNCGLYLTPRPGVAGGCSIKIIASNIQKNASNIKNQ